MSAPRPEGMSDQRLDAIKSCVERSLWRACQCQIPSCIYCQRNDLLAEVSRLRADGATLRERVKELEAAFPSKSVMRRMIAQASAPKEPTP